MPTRVWVTLQFFMKHNLTSCTMTNSMWVALYKCLNCNLITSCPMDNRLWVTPSSERQSWSHPSHILFVDQQAVGGILHFSDQQSHHICLSYDYQFVGDITHFSEKQSHLLHDQQVVSDSTVNLSESRLIMSNPMTNRRWVSSCIFFWNTVSSHLIVNRKWVTLHLFPTGSLIFLSSPLNRGWVTSILVFLKASLITFCFITNRWWALTLHLQIFW